MSNSENAQLPSNEHTEHELKIASQFFEVVESGQKPFEIRKGDRPFKIGDTLWLREVDITLAYTGREMRKRITFCLRGWGMESGYVALGLAPHGFETSEQRTTRVWIALKGNEKALTLSEADGWEVHEVVKAPVYRANSPEDIKQSMDLLQQIHQESNAPEGSDSSVKWLAYGCERKPFAHWRQECSADCPHAQKANSCAYCEAGMQKVKEDLHYDAATNSSHPCTMSEGV